MNGRQDAPDGVEITFEPRSVYFSCSACGCLVVADDRERHRRSHRVLSRALRDAAIR